MKPRSSGRHARSRANSPDGTILLVVGSFPSDSTFLLKKCALLLRKDSRIRIVCLESAPRRRQRQTTQSNDATFVAEHSDFAWTTESRVAAAVRLPLVLLSCLWRNPSGTLRYLRRGFRQFGSDVLRRLYLDAALIGCRPSLIHFEFGTLAVGRTHLAALLGCRIVVSCRGYDLNYTALDQRDYYSNVWAHADVVHVLGADLWARAVKRGCPPEKPHVLIAPGVDAGVFEPGERVHTDVAGTSRRPLRVLSVGRLVWKKGYEHALGAMRMLLDAGVRVEYRIVGDGDYIDAIAFARHQFDLEESVELVGPKRPDEVRDEMLWADVFLHPAVSEGFCNAVIEAQAMRLPVVCTDADGLAENVADGETGFVVPRRDTAAMATTLASLATDALLRQRMGEAGRRRAISRFSMTQQIEAFGSLYQALLEAP